MKNKLSSEQGFTLIELLTIIGIIGILASLGITAFSVYRGSAAYGVAFQTIRDARTAAEGSINNLDQPPAAVSLTAESNPGAPSNALARSYLSGYVNPKNVKIQVQYDPSCVDSTCHEDFLQVNHCFARDHLEWIRFGDGTDLLLEHVAGGGCP